VGMTDREKVIKDIKECLSASCRGFRPRELCPYNDDEWDIMRDALALMEEQEAAYQGAVELLRQKTILFDDAIKRLKEQEEPAKAKYRSGNKYGTGKNPVWHAYCSECGCRLQTKPKAVYCHKCGKRIEWEESDG